MLHLNDRLPVVLDRLLKMGNLMCLFCRRLPGIEMSQMLFSFFKVYMLRLFLK